MALWWRLRDHLERGLELHPKGDHGADVREGRRSRDRVYRHVYPLPRVPPQVRLERGLELHLGWRWGLTIREG